MSRELGKDFGHFAESLLPHLILLIPNSVRVMATSGSTTVRYIIKVSFYAILSTWAGSVRVRTPLVDCLGSGPPSWVG